MLFSGCSAGDVSVWSHMGQCVHKVTDTGRREDLQLAVAGLAFITSSNQQLECQGEEEEEEERSE